jgi:hypothetical protein
MRVAALYDIHGNLPALEAVLKEIRQMDITQVVGGDVLPGPMPRETMARLANLDLPVQFIQGNGDREVLAQMRGQGNAGLPKQAIVPTEWTARQLSEADEQTLAHWPAKFQSEIQGMGGVLFCHATPRSDAAIRTCNSIERSEKFA